MEYLNLEMALFDLKLKSVSPYVAKKFIRSMDCWLDSKVCALPHLVHLATCSLADVYEHARIKDDKILLILKELKREYGLRVGMSDAEVRDYYNKSLNGQPFGSTYSGPGTPEYLAVRYSLEDDIVKSITIFKERYKTWVRNYRDVAYSKYFIDMTLSHIEDIHEYAAKVIEKGSPLILKD